jgi:hypothetical protein
MTIDTELSDFNWGYLSQYGKIKFYASGRFWDAMTFDKATIDPYRLACEFYARHGFSFSPSDFYRQGNRMRYKCIDALVEENPSQLSDVGQMLYDGWVGYKKKLDADRAKEPELPKIEPAPPMPPKEEPKELPKVQTPKPPKNPFPTKRVIAAVIGILVTASAFLPPPWNLLAAGAFKLLQAAMGG